MQEKQEEKYLLGDFLREARESLNLGIREMCRLIEKNPRAGGTVSPSYYSQVEHGKNIKPEKISFDFFWAVSIVLEVDPVKLFLLSRPHIPVSMHDPKMRDVIFKKR